MILGESGLSVVVTAETARYLERLEGGKAMSRLRMSLRDGRNPQVSAELLEIRRAALSLATEPLPVSAEVGSDSAEVAEDWDHEEVGTTEAADYLGLTTRAVRLACEADHLHGEKVSGTWRISLSALHRYRAARDQRRKET